MSRLREWWPLAAVFIFVAVAMMAGGGEGRFGLAFSAIAATGFILLMTALAAGWLSAFGQLPMLARVALGLIFAFPILQLLPLPPAVWRALPGHDLRAEVLTRFGMGETWMPLSVTPVETAYTALACLSLFGLLLATLRLSTSGLRLLLWTIAGLVALGAAMGVVQFASGGQLFRMYTTAHQGALIGFFANKNHMGLALACLIPLSHVLLKPKSAGSGGELFLIGVGWLVILSLLVATNSRAGLGLGLFAVVLTAIRRFPQHRRRLLTFGIAGAVLIVLGTFFIPSISELFDRIGSSREDVRVSFLERSAGLVPQYGLSGSGIGSFVDVYLPIEQLEWLTPKYLNAVHNEYLQLAIEGGVPGLMILALLAAALLREAIRLGRRRIVGPDGDATLDLVWLGLVWILMFALHSVVDYPLRRMATATVFVIALALVFRSYVASRAPADN